MSRLSRITLRAMAATAATALLAMTACGSSTHAAHSTMGSDRAARGEQKASSGAGSMSMAMPTTGTAATADPKPAAAVGPHNAADAAFATDMVPHHAQAVQMANMALKSAGNAQVKSLATAIKAAQDLEITQMSGWLRGWKLSVPTGMGGMGGMNHSGTGMMSDADMTRLGKATGAAFDRMWVQMMISHHRGAINTARTELTDGKNIVAKALARSIVTSQGAQVAQLTKLLVTLPSA